MPTDMTPQDQLAALSEAELLPCPAECLHAEGAELPYVFQRTVNLFGVCCPACGAATRYFGTRAAARAAWNTRANQLAVIGPDAVEALRKAMHETLSRLNVMAYLDMPPTTADDLATAAIAALTGRG